MDGTRANVVGSLYELGVRGYKLYIFRYSVLIRAFLPW